MLIIQKATLKDARSISYLIQKNTESNPNKYTEEQIRTWINYNTPAHIKKLLESREIYCGFKNNKLVGTIGLKNNEIVGFYVSASERNKGIGKQLFNFIENCIIEKGYHKVFLTATPSALEFYKNNGFDIITPILVTIDNVTYDEFNMMKNL